MGIIDIPVESRDKYGKMDDWEAAENELADALAGGNTGNGGRTRPPAVASQPADDDVDAEFLRQAGNSPSHYGR